MYAAMQIFQIFDSIIIMESPRVHITWLDWRSKKQLEQNLCLHQNHLSVLLYLSKDVFERRASTTMGLFSFLSGISAQFFGQIVYIIRKRPRNANLVLSIYFKMKKISLPVDGRRLKTPLFKLRIIIQQKISVIIYYNVAVSLHPTRC